MSTAPASSPSSSPESSASAATSRQHRSDTAPIVVGVDGSAESAAALRIGSELARLLGAPLEAILAWQYPYVSYPGYPAAVDWSPENDAQALLESLTGEAFPDGTPEHFSAESRMGGAAAVLVDAAREARMLVVGGRGHGGFAGLLLGSVSDAVARHAPCPVLVLHGPAIPLASMTSVEPRPIIVGVDGSVDSVDALRLAAELSAALDCPLHVVTVWFEPVSFSGYPLALTWSPEADAQTMQRACLDDVFGGSLPAHVTVSVIEGRPAPALLEAASGARLLVLGARGRGGFAGLVLGSATDACVRHSPVPVLVVPDAAGREQRREAVR